MKNVRRTAKIKHFFSNLRHGHQEQGQSICYASRRTKSCRSLGPTYINSPYRSMRNNKAKNVKQCEKCKRKGHTMEKGWVRSKKRKRQTIKAMLLRLRMNTYCNVCSAVTSTLYTKLEVDEYRDTV